MTSFLTACTQCPLTAPSTIDSSVITFQTICLQLPTPRCHCSAAAEHTGEPGETAQDTYILHQTHKEKLRDTNMWERFSPKHLGTIVDG